MQFEVTKRFPKPNPYRGLDRPMVVFNDSFFYLIFYLTHPSSREIRACKDGKLQYGIFERDSIPFLIVYFMDFDWSMVFPINILKFKCYDDLDKWLELEANALNLFLVDTKTNVLEAARFIKISISEEIKQILKNQRMAYEHSDQVNYRILKISSRYTSREMIENSQMIDL